MKITVYEFLTESFEVEAPDDLDEDALAEWVEDRRVNGDDKRRLVEISDVHWEPHP